MVQGGPDHAGSQRLTLELLDTLHRLPSFAPLHLPAELGGMEVGAALYRDLPQVVCFDTAFHRGMPKPAQGLPVPRDLWDQGLRRYGFHGLSCQCILETRGGHRLPTDDRFSVVSVLGLGYANVSSIETC